MPNGHPAPTHPATSKVPSPEALAALQRLPDARLLSFHLGQVWESPRGTLYTVERVVRGGHAILRRGTDGRGRIERRPWDAVVGWVIWADPGFAADASSNA